MTIIRSLFMVKWLRTLSKSYVLLLPICIEWKVMQVLFNHHPSIYLLSKVINKIIFNILHITSFITVFPRQLRVYFFLFLMDIKFWISRNSNRHKNILNHYCLTFWKRIDAIILPTWNPFANSPSGFFKIIFYGGQMAIFTYFVAYNLCSDFYIFCCM